MLYVPHEIVHSLLSLKDNNPDFSMQIFEVSLYIISVGFPFYKCSLQTER